MLALVPAQLACELELGLVRASVLLPQELTQLQLEMPELLMAVASLVLVLMMMLTLELVPYNKSHCNGSPSRGTANSLHMQGVPQPHSHRTQQWRIYLRMLGFAVT